MNFHLSDDQIALQDAVRRYVADASEAGVRRKTFESETGFDREFWDGLMGLGVGGLVVGEDHGGLGLPLIDAALVAEVLGEEAAPGPFLGHTLAALAIQLAGDAAQRAKWLPRLASGEAIGTVAFGEAGDRWTPDQWTVKLDSLGALFGKKSNVLYPEFADLIVVGLEGGALAVVETADGGIESEALDGVDRTRRLSNVTFSDAHAEVLAGAAGAEAVLDAALVLLSADAFGGASRVLRMTAEYAKTRQQFGGPIARFQGLKHQLANLASEVEPARGLYWYAAVAYDARPEARSRIAALAKSHLADRFAQAGRTGVELHGGIGYTWEYDLQIWVKRSMFDFAYFGQPSFHRRRAAAMEDAAQTRAGSEAA
ncbi:MAG: acyl-CoA dehydrogenase family protein [Ignavibacteriales bacterium]